MANAAREILVYEGAGEVRRLALIPRPADPFHWNVLYVRGGEIVAGTVPVWSWSTPALHPHRFEMNFERPEVQQALRTAEGQTAQRFCRYLFADLIRTPEGLTVAFRDARFTVRGRHEFSIFLVPLKRDAAEERHR